MKNMFTKFNFIIYTTSLLIFTFCEQKTTVTNEKVATDDEVVTVTDSTTTTTTYGVDQEEKREFKNRINIENEELKDKIARLKERAKLKGKNADNDLDRAIDKLERQRVEFNLDSTDEKLEEKWQKLKGKISNAADSIDKRF